MKNNIIFIFLGLFLALATSVYADTEMTTCGNLSTANTIYFMQIPVSSAGTCYNVTADNITFYCLQREVDYAQSIQGYGFLVNANNFTLYNCTIIEGSTGSIGNYAVYLNNSRNSTVYENFISTNTLLSHGIHIENSGYNAINNNTITTNGLLASGIYFSTTTKNSLQSNLIQSYDANPLEFSGTISNHYNQNIYFSNYGGDGHIIAYISPSTYGGDYKDKIVDQLIVFNKPNQLITNITSTYGSAGIFYSDNVNFTSNIFDLTDKPYTLKTDGSLNNLSVTNSYFGMDSNYYQANNILLIGNGTNNNVTGNNVVITGTDGGIGIQLSDSNYRIWENTVYLTGDGLTGVKLISGVYGNSLKNNNIYLVPTSHVHSNYAIFDMNNNYYNTLWYEDAGINSILSWTKLNLTVGETNLTANALYNPNIFVDYNLIGFIPNENTTLLNSSALIAFNNLNYIGKPYLMKNGVRCDNNPTKCIIAQWNQTSGVLVALVYGFSNYTTNVSNPSLEFVSPENISYNTASVLVNISTTGDIHTLIYTNESGENTTYYNVTNVTFTHSFSDGTHTLYAYGYSDEGNVSDSVTFTVNTGGGGSTGGGGGGGGSSTIYFKVIGDDPKEISNLYNKTYEAYLNVGLSNSKINIEKINAELTDLNNVSIKKFTILATTNYTYIVSFVAEDYGLEDGQTYRVILSADGYYGNYIDEFSIYKFLWWYWLLIAIVIGLTFLIGYYLFKGGKR